jgi:hypothetical protein
MFKTMTLGFSPIVYFTKKYPQSLQGWQYFKKTNNNFEKEAYIKAWLNGSLLAL